VYLTEPIAPPPRIPRAAYDRYPVGDPSYRLGHLTSTSPATIIFVADVSFRCSLIGCGHEGTDGCNPTIGVT
jgi:hypothetical protein